jgi:TolA-binding protein
MYLRVFFLWFALTTVVAAQQADPAFLQRAITAVQTQRNLAMDAQAVAEARVASLTDDLTKAQARIKELEAKIEEKK